MDHPASARRDHDHEGHAVFARDLPFGAACHDGGVTFASGRKVERVDLVVEGGDPVPMTNGPDGWREATVAGAGPDCATPTACPTGARSRIRLPLPARRRAWPQRGDRPPAVRVGPSGLGGPALGGMRRLRAACRRLHAGRHVPGRAASSTTWRSLGVTAIQLMPIADFPGRRNWGYDGVLPFAPDSAYGRPEDLKALVDDAHGRGLMVFLDVVYNHFGPDGNYLPLYRAHLHRPAQDAVGRRRRFRRAPEPPRSRPRHRERALLAAGIQVRRPAARRGPRHHGRQRQPSPARAGRARARRDPGALGPPHPGERGERARAAPARRRRAASSLHRPVERRRPSRAAHGGHGRDGRLLRRLRRRRRPPGQGARRRVRLPGRGDALSGFGARRIHGGAAPDGLRQLHPEPRPGRQPRLRRPDHGVGARRGGPGRRGREPAVAPDPDAVHGRGVGVRRALSRSSASSAPNWRKRSARAGGRSSRASRSSRTRPRASGSPIPPRRPRSCPPSSTGTRCTTPPMRPGATGTPASSPSGAAPSSPAWRRSGAAGRRSGWAAPPWRCAGTSRAGAA